MSNEAQSYMEQVTASKNEVLALRQMIKSGTEGIPSILESKIDKTVHVSNETTLGLDGELGRVQIDANDFDAQALFLGILAGDLAENDTDILLRCPNFGEQGDVTSHTEISIAQSRVLEVLTLEAQALKVSPYLLGRQLYYGAETLQHTWYGADPTSNHDEYYGEISTLLMNNSLRPAGF